MLYFILKLVAYIIFKIFFNIKVFGRNYLPKDGGVIIASNHLSYLDPIVLGVASWRRLNFMAKKELFDNRAFSLLIKSLGAFPLERENSRGLTQAIKEALTRLRQGKVLVIFPEGSRSLSGKIQKALGGVGLIAYKAGCPVVPALIKGTDEVLPYKAKFVHLFKPISVHFGRAIRPGNTDKKESYQIFADRVMEEIVKLDKSI